MPWWDTFIQGKKQFDTLPAFIETLTRSWLLSKLSWYFQGFKPLLRHLLYLLQTWWRHLLIFEDRGGQAQGNRSYLGDLVLFVTADFQESFSWGDLVLFFNYFSKGFIRVSLGPLSGAFEKVTISYVYIVWVRHYWCYLFSSGFCKQYLETIHRYQPPPPLIWFCENLVFGRWTTFKSRETLQDWK